MTQTRYLITLLYFITVVGFKAAIKYSYEIYNSHSFEMFSQNSNESDDEMEKDFDFDNQNEDKSPHSSLETENETKMK